jgi:hypothetical protein
MSDWVFWTKVNQRALISTALYWYKLLLDLIILLDVKFWSLEYLVDA